MTDREYEKMMVEASIGIGEIEEIDEAIRRYTRQVDILMERRRELINRFNLNKVALFLMISMAITEMVISMRAPNNA